MKLSAISLFGHLIIKRKLNQLRRFLMRRFSLLTLALLLICKLTVQSQSIKGSDVLIIGDSFFAMSNEIKKFLENHARGMV